MYVVLVHHTSSDLRKIIKEPKFYLSILWLGVNRLICFIYWFFGGGGLLSLFFNFNFKLVGPVCWVISLPSPHIGILHYSRWRKHVFFVKASFIIPSFVPSFLCLLPSSFPSVHPAFILPPASSLLRFSFQTSLPPSFIPSCLLSFVFFLSDPLVRLSWITPILFHFITLISCGFF